MDDDLRTAAELTKLNFLLENLYALVLDDRGVRHEDIDELSEEVSRQASLPAHVYGPDSDPDDVAALSELVQHRIAMFFARVQSRMRSGQD
jgi:hypothetical protein